MVGCCCSVALLCLTLCRPVDCSMLVHHQLPELTQTHVHWVSDAIPTISSSVIPFSSYLQSFPASGYFPMNWLFTSDGQSIGASNPSSVLSMISQGGFPLGLTGLIYMLSKGLSTVFSSTMLWKHQLVGAHASLWSNSHICIWLLENPTLIIQSFVSSIFSCF